MQYKVEHTSSFVTKVGQKNISKGEHYNLPIVYWAKAAAKVHFGMHQWSFLLYCDSVILLREQIKGKPIEPLLREGF